MDACLSNSLDDASIELRKIYVKYLSYVLKYFFIYKILNFGCLL